MEESVRNIRIKKMLFGGIVCILFVPLIQFKLKFVDEMPLNGSFTPLESPVLTSENWFNGTYQDQKVNFLNENFGFRNFFVRTYNQTYYSLYNQARANGVVIGKQNYLYEENYIKAYLGSDFIGNELISEQVKKIQLVSDSLKAKGIELIIVFAPGKGSFYPEYIPEKYDLLKKSITNYEVYREQLSSTTIHFLDFNQWFRKMKKNAAYPLFPKTGIHWSKYGEILAADSIINYINSTRQNHQIPSIQMSKIEISSTMKDTDDDIEKGMNLLFDIKDLTMGYPAFEIVKKNENSPKVLTIADSYYWGLYFNLSEEVFNNGQFWYYNELIYPESFVKELKVSEIDIQKSVEENDVIMVLSTDANLSSFPFGFINQLYEKYTKSK